MNGEQRREYVREVTLALVGKEPEDYRMSVAEFGVLQHWMDKEVPLRVVLQAIEQVKSRAGRPSRLTVLYIKPAVEEEIERWQRALV
jgi:hypothetical protein